jgi:hypothetical protein
MPDKPIYPDGMLCTLGIRHGPRLWTEDPRVIERVDPLGAFVVPTGTVA